MSGAQKPTGSAGRIGELVTQGKVSGSDIFSALGGLRGVIESLAPGFLFLIVFVVTGQLVPSVLAPVTVAVAILLVRLIQGLSVLPAVSGGVGIALNAGFALWTGRAEDNFVGGFIANAAWLAALLLSLAIRKPLIAFIAGFFVEDDVSAAPRFRRVGYLATLSWCGFFAIRLLVQVPLWAAGMTTVLAATKLIMGLPFYAAMIWVTWWMMRGGITSRENSSTATEID